MFVNLFSRKWNFQKLFHSKSTALQKKTHVSCFLALKIYKLAPGLKLSREKKKTAQQFLNPEHINFLCFATGIKP